MSAGTMAPFTLPALSRPCKLPSSTSTSTSTSTSNGPSGPPHSAPQLAQHQPACSQSGLALRRGFSFSAFTLPGAEIHNDEDTTEESFTPESLDALFEAATANTDTAADEETEEQDDDNSYSILDEVFGKPEDQQFLLSPSFSAGSDTVTMTRPAQEALATTSPTTVVFKLPPLPHQQSQEKHKHKYKHKQQQQQAQSHPRKSGASTGLLPWHPTALWQEPQDDADAQLHHFWHSSTTSSTTSSLSSASSPTPLSSLSTSPAQAMIASSPAPQQEQQQQQQQQLQLVPLRSQQPHEHSPTHHGFQSWNLFH